jgi:hypothetical protein
MTTAAREGDRDDPAGRDRMTDPVDDIAAGRAACERIRGHDRKSWHDWLAVGRALVIGRAEMMAKANSNRPLGTVYNRLMGEWLKQHGFGDVNNQERYRIISASRTRPRSNISALDWTTPTARLNHPNAVWSHWPWRNQETESAAPSARSYVKAAMPSHKHGKPIHWPGDPIRRAASAIREVYSTDFYVMARRALEAAIRNEADLLELLLVDPPAPARRAADTTASQRDQASIVSEAHA